MGIKKQGAENNERRPEFLPEIGAVHSTGDTRTKPGVQLDLQDQDRMTKGNRFKMRLRCYWIQDVK